MEKLGLIKSIIGSMFLDGQLGCPCHQFLSLTSDDLMLMLGALIGSIQLGPVCISYTVTLFLGCVASLIVGYG